MAIDPTLARGVQQAQIAPNLIPSFGLGQAIADEPTRKKQVGLGLREDQRNDKEARIKDMQNTAITAYQVLGDNFDVNSLNVDNVDGIIDKLSSFVEIESSGDRGQDVQALINMYEGGKNLSQAAMAARGGAAGSLPSSVKETIWFNQQPKDIQKQHMELKRRSELSPEAKLDYQKRLKDIELQFEDEKRAREYEDKFKNEPELANAVEIARGVARDAAKVTQENRSNAAALATYEAAIGQMASALDNTATGPFVGWSPALTANQQIVEGASAVMAPVLKAIFREAGEGTFTKDDQEILMAMLPNRKDRKEARIAKLKQVDMVVRAKLKAKEVPSMASQSPEASEVVTVTSQENSGVSKSIDDMSESELDAFLAE